MECKPNLNVQRFIPLRARRSLQIVTAGGAALQRYTLGYLARCGVIRNFTDDAKHHLHRKRSLRGESGLAKQVWSGILNMTRLQLAVAPSMDLASPLARIWSRMSVYMPVSLLNVSRHSRAIEGRLRVEDLGEFSLFVHQKVSKNGGME